ncbi:hypothetical protein GJ496_003813 [Pomphorhynchus laevis]|nr:hypothetical protein GJ496_003813 [Pomphorhynchus laevis]
MQKPSQEVRAKVLKVMEWALSSARHPTEQAVVLEANLYERATSLDEYLGMIKAFCTKIGIEVGSKLRDISSDFNPDQNMNTLLSKKPHSQSGISYPHSMHQVRSNESVSEFNSNLSSGTTIQKPFRLPSPVSLTSPINSVASISSPTNIANVVSPESNSSNIAQDANDRQNALLNYCIAYIPRLRVFCQQQQGKIAPNKLSKIVNILDLLDSKMRVPTHFLTRCKEFLENTFPDVHSKNTDIQSLEHNKMPPASPVTSYTTVKQNQSLPETSTTEKSESVEFQPRSDLSIILENFFSKASLDYKSAVYRASQHTRNGLDLSQYDTCVVNSPSEWPIDALAKRTKPTSSGFDLIYDEIHRLSSKTLKIEITNSPANSKCLLQLKCTITDPSIDFSPSLCISASLNTFRGIIDCSCWDYTGRPRFEGGKDFPEFVSLFQSYMIKQPPKEPLQLETVVYVLKQCVKQSSVCNASNNK